jgi:hypothetical protein
MPFAFTRFYPVNYQDKVIYLDTQTTKAACDGFPGCIGMSGDRLNKEWMELSRQGFTLKRLHKDRRGGPGRNQGRPKMNLPKSAALRISVADHQRVSEHIAALNKATGRWIAIQAFSSELIMKADWNALVEAVQPIKGNAFATTINEDAAQRLVELIKRIKPLRPDIRVTRGNVFAAIVRLELDIGNLSS